MEAITGATKTERKVQSRTEAYGRQHTNIDLYYKYLTVYSEAGYVDGLVTSFLCTLTVVSHA